MGRTVAKVARKTIGYLRVLTADQDLDKNKADILHFVNEKKLGTVEWVKEKASGKVSCKRPEIAQVIDSLKQGGSILVAEPSRLGRSMLECMEILSIALESEINMYAVKGNWQLDQSIQSKIVAMAFSMATEIERDLISQHTKEALAARKKEGVKLGRPKGTGKSKLDAYKPEIESQLKNGATQKFIAQRYGATEATVSR